MSIFKSLETYVYTAVAGALLTATAHNPALHDLSVWFLGVLGHAIGVAQAKAMTGSNGAAP
jgi:hypothetical protein